ncbi:hypothetical protein [Mucilaginibacter aquariorum]|uniref:Uncharacterized protein n=1 Tax=Mucilaginibacter aquariorum TaxID=2967225 RepID=A0ABT1T5W3_9SPHI|nr:hypothetical protein [Mucilaginibacter aquariorum]MCQ6959959.1 hypothetical protein [Mucilaginibacter aquariorum]
MNNSALGIGADTGPWLMPVQYERKAWAAGNAQMAMPANLTPQKKPPQLWDGFLNVLRNN